MGSSARRDVVATSTVGRKEEKSGSAKGCGEPDEKRRRLVVGVEEEETEAAAEARRKDEQQSDRRDGPSGPKKHSAPNATALVDLSVCVCAWVGVLGEERRTLRPVVRISGGFHSAVSVRKNSDERGAAGTEKKIAKAQNLRAKAQSEMGGCAYS